MNGEIKVRLHFATTDKETVLIIDKTLQIFPSVTRSRFPKSSIAPPYWETEVTTNSGEVSDAVQELCERVAPKTQLILDVCHKYQITPIVWIVISADYEQRPFISFLPEQIHFFHIIGAELLVDLEGVYPE